MILEIAGVSNGTGIRSDLLSWQGFAECGACHYPTSIWFELKFGQIPGL
jgi:hypothetical protein